jgi:hypothetical protein
MPFFPGLLVRSFGLLVDPDLSDFCLFHGASFACEKLQS